MPLRFVFLLAVSACTVAAYAQAPATAPGQLPTADSVAATLNTAKAAHQQSLAAAKAALLNAIDARVNTATAAGDLKMLTMLRTTKAAAEVNGDMPVDLKDASVLGAKDRQKQAVQSANATLVRAYEAAVRDYTRNKQIDQAMAVQAELDATKLKPAATPTAGGPAQPAKPPEPIQRLAKVLPPQFTANDTYSVAKDGGIIPKSGTAIVSKRTEFLSREYIFDVWVQIEKTGEGAWAGVGNGHWDNVLAVGIHPPQHPQHGAILFHGDPWGEGMTDVREPGIYVLRVERHGTSMTFSVGAEKDGKLEFYASRSVFDPKGIMPLLDEKSAHLCFGGEATFKQYRLTIMPPSAPVVAAPGTIVPLTRDLTPEITAYDTFTAPLTGGIIPKSGTFFLFRPTSFLDKDKEYLLDVWVKLEKRGGWSSVGIGDGRLENSVALSLRPAGEQHHGVALQRGEQWGERMGEIREPGVYIARIEKHGASMTFSVGREKNGSFDLDCTKTLSNPKALQPGLSERSAHLYFGGDNLFLKYRLVLGPDAHVAANAPFAGQPAVAAAPAVTPTVPVAPPAVPSAPPVAPPVPPVPPAVPGAPSAPPVAPAVPAVTPAVPAAPPVSPAPAIGTTVPSATPPKPPAVETTPNPAAPPVANIFSPPAGNNPPPAAHKVEFMSIGTLASKAAPKLSAGDGRITFSAPEHDKSWKGANGVVLPAGASWTQVGTILQCKKFYPKPWGVTLIHPLGDGHVLIDIGDGGVNYRDDGHWDSRKGWTNIAVQADFKDKFPLDKDTVHTLRSEMLPSGQYQLFIDGKLAATAKFNSAKALNFDAGFKGAGLPTTLAKGFAGAIVQNSFRFVTTAGDLSLSPTK